MQWGEARPKTPDTGFANDEAFEDVNESNRSSSFTSDSDIMGIACFYSQPVSFPVMQLGRSCMYGYSWLAHWTHRIQPLGADAQR